MKARVPDDMRGGKAGMMAQIQKMQADMAQMQKEVEDSTFSAQSGGGAVQVCCNGKQELLSLTLTPDVVDRDDVELLQDLILAAANEALRAAAAAMQEGIDRTQTGVPGLQGLL